MQESLSQSNYQSVVNENTLLSSKLLEQEILIQEQEVQIQELQSSLEWFRKQTLEKRSEKFYNHSDILPLFKSDEIEEKPAPGAKVAAHIRKKRGKTQDLGNNQDSGLRFDDNVEIRTEDVYPEEIKGLSEDEYEIIGEEFSDRLACRESKTFIHRRVFHKVKLKSTKDIVKAPVPNQVISRGYLSVSFLVDMLLDKTLYSIPLYRQHQRLKLNGIHLSRGMLSTNFIKTCSLLSPIVNMQLESVLLSRKLAIDETPIKVGVDKLKHKMKKGYVWPIYGERGEIVYNYNRSRGACVLRELLGDYNGIILSDGYSAYKSYADGLKESALGGATQASCWVHARRKFVELEKIRPTEYRQALEHIAGLYKVESDLSSSKVNVVEVLSARQKKSVPIVDAYFDWLRSFDGKAILATNSKLRAAINYSLEREESLRVFLKNPELELDTNHLEREIRPIAIGRKNWMFCWTEIGAESLCIAQTLIRTCLLQGVNPRTYLIDVLQRLAIQPDSFNDIASLIPRFWKEEFAVKDRLLCPSQAALELSQNS